MWSRRGRQARTWKGKEGVPNSDPCEGSFVGGVRGTVADGESLRLGPVCSTFLDSVHPTLPVMVGTCLFSVSGHHDTLLALRPGVPGSSSSSYLFTGATKILQKVKDSVGDRVGSPRYSVGTKECYGRDKTTRSYLPKTKGR